MGLAEDQGWKEAVEEEVWIDPFLDQADKKQGGWPEQHFEGLCNCYRDGVLSDATHEGFRGSCFRFRQFRLQQLNLLRFRFA